MKVVHVSKFYYPKVGGIERVAHDLAKASVEAGDTVTAVSAVESGRGERESYDGVSTVKSSSLGVVLSVPLAPTFPVNLQLAKSGADLLHFHLPDPLAVTSELLTGHTDAVSVATFHNEIANPSHQRILGAYRPLLDRFLSGLDAIVVTSPRLRDRSSILQSYRGKCTVVPLGIDLEEFESYSGPSDDLPGDPDRPTVLFVGRLIYYKGLEYAIEAMANVDADLLIAGRGDRGEALRNRARRLGLSDRVHFLGYVPEEKLHYAYEKADLFVFPSIATSEGFGLVQLEAMAHGTPVVNTNLDTGVPWVSRDGVTGLTVPPENAAALASALNELLGDPDRRARFGRAARERVREHFTRSQMVDGYLELYADLTR